MMLARCMASWVIFGPELYIFAQIFTLIITDKAVFGLPLLLFLFANNFIPPRIFITVNFRIFRTHNLIVLIVLICLKGSLLMGLIWVVNKGFFFRVLSKIAFIDCFEMFLQIHDSMLSRSLQN